MANVFFTLGILKLVLLLGPTNIVMQYLPERLMPYRKILGTSYDISTIGNTLKCAESKNSLNECSDECFKLKHLGQNCVGFLTSNGTTCDLCETTGAGDHTPITPGHTFYLLQGEALKPNIHIDMEGIDLDAGTITGIGVSGTFAGFAEDDISEREDGTHYLRFSGGARLAPQVSQPECYCSSDYCNGKITLSFWIMPLSSAVQHIATPENYVETGLTCVIANYNIDCKYRSPGTKLFNIRSSSALVSSQWAHVAVVVKLNSGASVYLDGVSDGFKEISEAESHPDTNHLSCSTVLFGVRNTALEYPLNANMDEIKYFYDALSPTVIWQEYMTDKGLDFTPQLFFTGSDAYTNQMALLFDNNDTSCITLSGCTNGIGFVSKVLNRALNKSNFTVTIHIMGLTCQEDALYVYREEIDFTQPQNGRMNELFEGYFKELEFLSEAVDGEAYRCKYRSMAPAPVPYVYIKGPRVSSGDICEVRFDV